jgi:general secretion pathway protein D
MRSTIFFFNRLTAVILTAALLGPILPLEARTKKGDKYLAEGRVHEQKKEWDQALESYGKALSEDPADILYQMANEKARFQTAQSHIDKGLKIRAQGQLGEALIEFQKAYAINPGSAVAEQEIRRTTEMIERERKRVQETGKESDIKERALTPGEQSKRDTEQRIASILPVPDLKPLNQEPIHLRLNGSTKLLFETVAKVANINVLWDPEYQPQVRGNIPVEFENSSIEEALDYLAVITKSYWKPLSPNTIFITMDNPNKRRDYEEQVAKVFYLSNVNTPQELQEIVNAVRSIADIQRFFPYNSQNAIIAKGSADQVALAEKILHDLDKPKSEVVVDIIVMEASSVYTRQLTAAIANTGLNIPANFTPRGGLQVVNNPSTTTTGTTTTGTSTSTGTTTPTTTTPSTSSTTGSLIPFSNLGRISSADFSTTIPSAVLQLVLSDGATKVLQSPQLRAVDNVKATLKIGDRQPTATGSFQPGIGGVGINPLVNTQFTYIDVGVNVELTPRVHDNGDVSMHIDLDISSVTGHVNLGGIDQPIIGQRKVSHDIRMHEGSVQLLGGLTKWQDTKTKTGVPGLASVPILGRLFSGESVDRERQELMIALIPHIVRRPEYTAENLRGIAVGNQASVHLNYGHRNAENPPAGAAPKKDEPAPPAAAAPPVVPPGTPAVAQTPMAAPGMSTPGTGAPVPAAAPPGPAPPATAPPLTAPGTMAPATTAPGTIAPGTIAPGAPAPAGTTSIAPAADAPKPDAAKPVGNATVHFLPPQVDTNPQGMMTIALIIENANDVASAPLQVSFDPKVVKLNDVGRGDFFTSDGQIPVFTKNIQNDAGAAAVNLNRLPGTPGASGSGVLANFIFQAVAKGTTTVTIPNLTVRNSQGQVVFSGSPQMTINVK